MIVPCGEMDVGDRLGRAARQRRVGNEFASAMAGASGDGHTWAARLAGDDRTLIDDDEFAVESLLQIDTAAGVRATTRARRDVYQPLLKPHARLQPLELPARESEHLPRLLRADPPCQKPAHYLRTSLFSAVQRNPVSHRVTESLPGYPVSESLPIDRA